MNKVDKYIEHIKSNKTLSQNTINSYLCDIKKYNIYLTKQNLELTEITKNDIITYIIQLEENNMSTASISRNISSIKSFHDFLFLNRLTDVNPATNIKKPKIEKHNIDILTKEEIEGLLNSHKLDTPISIRDKAIFEVMYGTGIKVSELIGLDIEDINIDIDYINCNSNKAQRVIPLSDTTKMHLQHYIENARFNLVKGGDEKALFVNLHGQRFTRQGLWKIIKKYAQIANIDKNINPNLLRHSFAIHLLNEGANISVVSKILGNNNLSSLQCYLTYINKNIRKEIKEKHPRK